MQRRNAFRVGLVALAFAFAGCSTRTTVRKETETTRPAPPRVIEERTTIERGTPPPVEDSTTTIKKRTETVE